MNDAIQEFLKLLRSEATVAVEVDEPADPTGEWWIDLVVDSIGTTVSWSPKIGFGVFSKEAGYGSRPNEIYHEPYLASARILQLAAQRRRNEQAHALDLRELRHLVGATQIGIAGSLGTDQARVSRIENATDIKLSALISYLDAMGATLELKAHFPSFEALIEPVDIVQLKQKGKQLCLT